MNHQGERKNMILRTKVENIAQAHFYKPVSESNNIFLRMKRNSSVLSRNREYQPKDVLTSRQNHVSSKTTQVDDNSSIRESSTQIFNHTKLKRYQSFSLPLQKKSNKNLIISPTLPQIRQSKQIVLPSPRKSSLFKQNTLQSKNQIEGTKIGVLSSKQILKKYEIKKLKQELDKKIFLDNHIKNIKLQDYNSDQESQNESLPKKTVIKSIFDKFQGLKKIQIPEKKQVDLSESQQKLTQLLGNRLTDRDFIDFNVKLFEKKDINKKKYFQRYHNILKKQRQKVSKEQKMK